MSGIVDFGQKALESTFGAFFQGQFDPMEENGMPRDISELGKNIETMINSAPPGGLVAVPKETLSIAGRTITALSNTYVALVKAMAPQQTHLCALRQIVDKEFTPFVKASIGTQVTGLSLTLLGLSGVMYFSGGEAAGRRRLFCGLAVCGIGLVAYPILLASSLFRSPAYLAHLDIRPLV